MGKDADQRGEYDGKSGAEQKRLTEAPAEPLRPARAEVLRHKRGECIAEILHRQIGKGVDLDRRRKGGHRDGAEAVHQPLNEQNAEVHGRLLRAGEHREVEQFPQNFSPEAKLRPRRKKFPAAQERVGQQADAGDILRKHGRGGRARDAPVKDQHEQQVKPDVQKCGNPEKPERRDGISDRAQQAREEIINGGRKQSGKNNQKIGAHIGGKLRRDLQKQQDFIEEQIDRRVQQQRHAEDQPQRVRNGAAERRLVLLPETDGKQRARAHGQAEENRRQKRHERVRRPDGGQRVAPERAAHDQRIGDVVELLKEVSRDHRQRKQHKALCDISLCQISVHDSLLRMFSRQPPPAEKPQNTASFRDMLRAAPGSE